MKKKILLTLSIMILFAVNLCAIELKYDDKVFVETALYDEDYMFLGETLDFQGEARDLYLFDKNIDFSVKSKMAFFAFVQAINMAGSSKNGIKAAGQNVKAEGNIKGTSFIAAEEVMIDPKSQIDGDTFIGAIIINIKGKWEENWRNTKEKLEGNWKEIFLPLPVLLKSRFKMKSLELLMCIPGN